MSQLLTHILDRRDETNNTLCGRYLPSGLVKGTNDPLAAAVDVEDRGYELCGTCKRVIIRRFGTVKRWGR